MAHSRKGVFVTVEGGEGVGKTLFIANLFNLLQGLGCNVTTTREPGGTPTAERLRQIFSIPPESDPLTPESELFIISAARAQHVHHKISPALNAGQWIICDRFADSTFVYQGTMGGVSPSLIAAVTATSTYGLSPDITFLLDCEVELSLARIKKRQKENGSAGEADRYDDAGLAFHAKLRQAYLQLAANYPDRIVLLDAGLAPKAIAQQAFAILKERFSLEAKSH